MLAENVCKDRGTEKVFTNDGHRRGLQRGKSNPRRQQCIGLSVQDGGQRQGRDHQRTHH